MVEDSTEVDFMEEATTEEVSTATGFLAMATPTATDLLVMATGMLDVDTTADITADTAHMAVAAASTPRSGAPTRPIMDVFGKIIIIAPNNRGCLN